MIEGDTLLLFVGVFEWNRIGLFFSPVTEEIEVLAERRLVIGIFANEEALPTKLMKKIRNRMTCTLKTPLEI
jgi:hypothetical protein